MTRSRRSLLFVLLSFLPLLTTAAVAAPLGDAQPAKATLTLARDGKAAVPIVISEKASEATRAVAAEVAGYLKQITGAEFEIKTGDGASGIVLGTLAEFPDPALAEPLKINGAYDGREAFAIRTEPNRVRLIGATDLAASHAAFRFLELLGCRWFFPAREWEVVPTAPTLDFAFNVTDRPALLARRIWYGYGNFTDDPASGRTGSQDDYQAWARHNRMAGSFTVNAGHAWQSIIADNHSIFEQHPEYLALVNGKRQGEQFCVSNPAVRKIATEYVLNFLRKNPSADMASIETSDGGGHCECEDCKKLGSISDRAFGLANEVAKAVAAEFPGKMVGMYAYNDHCEPPSFPLEPNVYVQLTAGFITGQYTFDELLELWPKKSENIGYYEYFSVWLWDFDRLPGGRAADISYISKQIPRYIAQGATSLDCESGNNWGPHGRGYYVANRLMWDENTDVDALLADFYDKAFGPAAAPMQRYYERLDPGNKPLMSRHLLALAFRDLEEATTLAGDRPDVLARLDHLKQYLRYVHLRWVIDRESDKAKQKELTLAALTHAYRTRYSYMNHWEAIRQSWTAQAAETFGEPSWSAHNASEKPWKVDQPYSREETEAAFREGLAYFQPQPVEERSFTENLVPAKFEGAAASESHQKYQGSVPYALYSVKGEPLVVDATTGIIEWYRDRADARYTLRSTDASTVDQGRLPLDGKPHRLEFKVPAAGLYHFDFDDSAAGWGLQVAADKPVSILLQRERGFAHMGHMQEMFFYVPKGTKEIHYFWEGGPHNVFGPDGQQQQEVKTSGEIVTLPVPAGMDGKPWSLRQLALGHLWFFNCPNVLAASPNALLLPAELVEQDGLARLP